MGAGGVAREFACCSACDSLRDLRAASASTLRIASSSARRSFVICASKSAGWFERSCATSALRARSYSARRALPGAPVQPLDGAGDERIIIGHGLRLRSVAAIFTQIMSRMGSASESSLRGPDLLFPRPATALQRATEAAQTAKVRPRYRRRDRR